MSEMPKLPLLGAPKLCSVLEKCGFVFLRQHGSHMVYGHHDGRTTVIPNHPGEVIDRGLMNKIIKKDLRMTREEFLRLLE